MSSYPADMLEALAQEPRAAAAFEALSYSGKRRFTLNIEAAKTPETRARRIESAIAALRGEAAS